MRSSVLAAGLTALLTLSHAFAGEGKTGDVRDVIQAKDFWDKDGKKGGRKWSGAEQAQLAELKTASKDDVIRLRASRVLVELAGKAGYYNIAKDDDAVAVAGFRYLEANVENAHVQKMLNEGITHYSVSLNTKRGCVCMLVESLGNKSSGGLNLYWDAEKKEIVEMQAWGSAK
jgi:hypothetical protein